MGWCGNVLEYVEARLLKVLTLEQAKFKCLNGNCKHQDFYEKTIQHLPVCKSLGVICR